jgi:hypothetical protein
LKETGAVSSPQFVLLDEEAGATLFRVFRGGYFPKCKKSLVLHAPAWDFELVEIRDQDVGEFRDLIWPTARVPKPLPPEVPAEYREDFDEATIGTKRAYQLLVGANGVAPSRLARDVVGDKASLPSPPIIRPQEAAPKILIGLKSTISESTGFPVKLSLGCNPIIEVDRQLGLMQPGLTAEIPIGQPRSHRGGPVPA